MTAARPSFAIRSSTGASVVSLAIASLYSSLIRRSSCAVVSTWAAVRPRVTSSVGSSPVTSSTGASAPLSPMLGFWFGSMSIAKPKLWSERRWGALRFSRRLAAHVLRSGRS